VPAVNEDRAAPGRIARSSARRASATAGRCATAMRSARWRSTGGASRSSGHV